ncbi:2-phosphosulfolactate phosphatase [Paenibacillus hamazuiensis]|uniref:2-phosphosulfolactate phosphatase n=1 Tax=Paenibacillus hamazuiensis TaxID=2936508 RepID=UPI00200F386E|nr:2-phosphosulfolactate phosphatase [Paenibacillus hamazuiensis]
MNIQVISSVDEALSDGLAGNTVVVIDVLRATSTLITALVHGCAGVVPVETVQQAKQAQKPGDLLGGERFCQKIPGFDLGNSPFEYRPETVAGRNVILTTTNGTRAVQKSQKAAYILAGALLNASACAEKALELGKDITILCSGTGGVYSLEDGLCAGLLVEEMVRLAGPELQVGDFGLAMMYAYGQVKDRLTEALFNCYNGKRLTKLGFSEDILYCSRVNAVTLVPMYHNGVMK